MKPKNRLILLGIPVGVLLIILLWQSRTSPRSFKGTSNSVAAAVEKNPRKSREHETNLNSVQKPQPALIGNPNTKTAGNLNQIAAAIEGKNVPINFWGLIVDQNDSPLSGVEISAHTRTWMAGIHGLATFPKFEEVSDRNGLFEILDAKGDVLKIDSLKKEGYTPEPEALRSFGFNTAQQFRANPQSPVVLRLWKNTIKEDLITSDKKFTIIPDGRPLFVNLLEGSIKKSADQSHLSIWVKRPESVIFGQHYDWSCGIEVIDGGLLEERDSNSSMYSAPIEGYISTFTFEQKAGANGWSDATGTRRFYLRLDNGKIFARISINISSYYNKSVPGRIRISYSLNPSGSRVLR